MSAAFPTAYAVGQFDLCSFLFVFGQLESDLLNSRLKGLAYLSNGYLVIAGFDTPSPSDSCFVLINHVKTSFYYIVIKKVKKIPPT